MKYSLDYSSGTPELKTNPGYDVIVDYSVLESFDSHLSSFNKNQ